MKLVLCGSLGEEKQGIVDQEGKLEICTCPLIFEKSPNTVVIYATASGASGRSGDFLCRISGRGDCFVQNIIGMCRRYEPGATLQRSHAAF